MRKFILFLLLVAFSSCKAQNTINDTKITETMSKDNLETAIFGAGCFWCIEACFNGLKGVQSITPGYSGGHTENPTYRQVCDGNTGHAEVAKIIYDSTIISYDDLLEMFWFVHDPTQLNRQGNDIGDQYRSVIFYLSQEQQQKAENYKKRLEEEKVWDKPILTQILPLAVFYKAEEYHNNYFELNPENQYCQNIVRPKVEKFRKVFAERRN